MKKVLIILVLVLIVGCSNTQNQEGDYLTGTEGIVMSFVPGFPPARMYEDQEEFTIMLKIDNKGVIDVGKESFIAISGFDQKRITLTDLKKPIPGESDILAGKSMFNPNGESTNIEFDAKITLNKAEKDLLTTKPYSPPIAATACYKYGTVATSNICVDPDPFSRKTNKICTPAPIEMGSQGSPIAITNIGVEPSPKKTILTIDIENLGGGEVVSNVKKLNECDPNSGTSFTYNELNTVKLNAVDIAGETITASCKPKDNIRLIDGKGRIICSLEHSKLQSKSAFVSQITVVLEYLYRSTIQMPIEIIRIPG